MKAELEEKAKFKDFLLCFITTFMAVLVIMYQQTQNKLKHIEAISGHSYEEWLEKAEYCKDKDCVLHFDFGDNNETND